MTRMTSMPTAEEQIQSVIHRNKDNIAFKIVDMQYTDYPEYWNKFGLEGRRASLRDAAYHLPFLTEAIVMKDEKIFTDYVEWVKMLFKEINLPEEVMINTLKYTKQVLREFLSEEHHKVAEKYLDKGISQLNKPVKEPETYIKPEAPLGKLAKSFNEALLKGNKNLASNMIMEEVAKGTSIQDIYLHVFQASQKEIGRLWLLNKINVAKEHYVSAATQMIMSQLYPYIFSTERKGLSFVGACVGGELHEIGIRMVGDFFEMDGWDTYYLGANTPLNTLISAVKDYNADVLGLSIAMPYHQSMVKEFIAEIRKNLDGRPTKILVGGNGIKEQEKAIKDFNADGFAPDAKEAVKLANKLIQKHD